MILARTYFSIPALLLLCFVFICPAAAVAKETIFQNPYYVFSWNDAGNIRVTDLAKKAILSSAQYQADYGTIYNAMTPSLPKGTNKITLDQPTTLQPGSDIEIRSESFGGRLNAPVVHRAKVDTIAWK